jgi:hypothetical protein
MKAARALFALLLLILAAPAQAGQAPERRAVLSTVQRFFDALAARDQAALMALVVPDGRITSHSVRDGRAVVQTRDWQQWASRIASADERLEERMYAPQVRIRGTLATVWTEYVFRRNGAFSHCGVDLFDMAKVDGRWRIVNVSFTVETERCRRR